jgi:hypothetical protein
MQNKVTFTMNIDKELHRKLKTYVVSSGTTIKDYILGLIKNNLKSDETDYLLSTKANKIALEKAMDDVNNGKNLVEVELVDGIYRRKIKN